MLVRFTPEQVTKFWYGIEAGIASALPPGISNDPDKMNNLLASILIGKTDCWISYERNEQGMAAVNGAVLTQIVADESGARNLLLYAVYGVVTQVMSKWAEGYEVLRKWAAANSCAHITAYTDRPEICELAKRYGGNAEWRYIILPV